MVDGVLWTNLPPVLAVAQGGDTRRVSLTTEGAGPRGTGAQGEDSLLQVPARPLDLQTDRASERRYSFLPTAVPTPE